MVHGVHHVGVPITLEQARAFEALAQAGTFQAAARVLRKSHTSVLHAVRIIEEQVGITVLDRSGYRTRLTPAGERVLSGCRKLLAAERELAAHCEELKTGWEPRLGVVFDGVVPPAWVLAAAGALVRAGAPTRLDVRAEFLSGVEDAFDRSGAHLMVTVLPPPSASVRSFALAPLPASLVVHRDHPLAAVGNAPSSELERHVLLTVRGSDPRLVLPTAALEPRSTIHLQDFATKRAALLEGLGYGWMPDASIGAELRGKRLLRVRWEGASRHRFEPRLVHRRDLPLGRAARLFADALRKGSRDAR